MDRRLDRMACAAPSASEHPDADRPGHQHLRGMCCLPKASFFWAGLVVVIAGIFDMVDGEVARRTKRVTKFGAFFDSVIDRYSDMVLLLGLVIWYAKINRIFYVGLTGFVLIGSIMTSYTRARAESLIPACKVGFLERPERIVLLIIGALAEPDGRSPVGHGDSVELDGVSADLVHVAGNVCHGTRGNLRSHLKQHVVSNNRLPSSEIDACRGRCSRKIALKRAEMHSGKRLEIKRNRR